MIVAAILLLAVLSERDAGVNLLQQLLARCRDLLARIAEPDDRHRGRTERRRLLRTREELTHVTIK